jgi:hypothetical protein
VDAVALHDADLRDGEEESVEFFQGFGHAWKPAVRHPCVPGRYAEFTVCPVVVGGDEGTNLTIECGQVEHGLWCAGSRAQASRQRGEYFGY